MHVFLLMRGIKHDLDRFINELSAKYLPFKYRKPGDKELKDYSLQMRVSPIQLYDISFPSEHRDIVCSTLFPDGKGQTQHKKHEKFIWAIRKALGVQPLKPFKQTDPMPCYLQNCEMIAIGEKPDYWVTKDDKKVDKWEEGAFEGI